MRVGRRVTLAFLVLGLNVCLVEVVAAQGGSTTGPGPIAQSVERVVAVVSSKEAEKSPDEEGAPVFRSGVTRDVPLSSPLWTDANPPFQSRPPGGTLTHYEYLRATTPEAFRSSTLYPPGVSVDPGKLVGDIKSAWREWQARRVRERIEQELAQLRGDAVPR